MAISTVIKTKADGTIRLEDGTSPTPNDFTIAYEAGDLSITVPHKSVSNFLDRGAMPGTPSLRYNEDQPITFSFTCNFRDLSDASYVTMSEILLQSGAVGSGWVSTLGANAEVFCVSLTWTVEGTDHGDASDHSLTLPHCVVTGAWSEGEPNTISITGTSYAVLPTSIT